MKAKIRNYIHFFIYTVIKQDVTAKKWATLNYIILQKYWKLANKKDTSIRL